MQKISANGVDTKNTTPLIPVDEKPIGPEPHIGNRKRLIQALEDYSMTMQHAVRNNIWLDLVERAKQDSSALILPPLTPPEMFNFLLDTDEEFINWMFPFCPVKLTRTNMDYIHQHALSQAYQELVERQKQIDDANNK